MSFKLMKLPVLTGLSSIEQYKPKEKISISSIRLGVPCLIMNRKVCNLNGIPFSNSEFQDDFKELSNRIYDCDSIAIGTIVDVSAPYSSKGLYSFDLAQKVTYNSKRYTITKDSIVIELYDLEFNKAKHVQLRSRFALLANIIKNISLIVKRVELADTMEMTSFDKNKFKSSVLASARLSNNLMIRDLDSKYIGGSPLLNETRSFILNPFEEVEDEVEDVTLDVPTELKGIQSISNIISTIRFKNSKVTVDYSKSKEYTRYAIARLIADDSKIKFEAVIDNGKYLYQRPL